MAPRARLAATENDTRKNGGNALRFPNVIHTPALVLRTTCMSVLHSACVCARAYKSQQRKTFAASQKKNFFLAAT